MLAQCVTRGKVRRALQDLPKTLDETYARILRAIDEGQNAEEAVKILIWLACAERPLTAIEVCQVTGIVIGEECLFDEDEVLQDSTDILRICSSFVSIAIVGDNGMDDNDSKDDDSAYSEDQDSGMMYVRLAHFCVKEYLISSRPCLERYKLENRKLHDRLATSCLVYLLRFNNDEWRTLDCESKFPLADYAANFWTVHARRSGSCSQQQQQLSMDLLTRKLPAFTAWIHLSEMGPIGDLSMNIRSRVEALPSPLYAASREGVTHAAKQILEENCTDVNKLWINDDNPLHAASSRGHEKIVEILLAEGADVNAQGGYYNNALHAASDRGFDGVVSMLLAHGANVDAQGDRHGTALHAASDRGRKTIVQMLTAKGADVNAQGGYFGNALQAASHRGHEEIVRMLLAAGADVNAQGGEYGNALQAALVAGEGNVVQMLLDALGNPPAIRSAV